MKQPMHLPELCRKSVTELCALLADRAVSAEEITRAYLESIASQNAQINAYLEVYEQEAVEQARQSDGRRRTGKLLSPLDGIPVAIKDNIVMKGHRCTCASKMLESFVSPYDATVTQRLLAAGMPVLGRLNMDEFAMGGSTENSAFGVTRNPHDLARVPGGSSGGSAAAVAASMAPIALGSDTGGSIRQPASFCGTVGVKPAYGAISRYGLVAFASSLDQIGVLSKTPRDAALLLDVIGGHDPKDMTSDASLLPAYEKGMNAAVMNGLVLGLPRECSGNGLHPQVEQAMQQAVKRLEALGARVKEVSIPSLAYALPAYYVLSSAEASSNLARYDGVRYGHRAEGAADLEELYRRSRREGFGEEVKRRILLGTFALSSGYQDQYYLKAQQARELLRRETEAALSTCGALLTPVAPSPAYRLGEKTKDPMEMYLGDVFTVPANLTGLPALSVPCPGCELPVGMGLTGARQSLPMLLGLAEQFAGEGEPT